jgi:hypothetical protein
MRRQASVPARLPRVERQRAEHIAERQIDELAAFYELDPGEVRHALRQIQAYRARYGLEPVETTIARLAAEFDLDPAEQRADYEASRARWEERR